MSDHSHLAWTRRDVLRGLSVFGGAGLLGLGAGHAAAEPPPETRSIRLMQDPNVPILCYAPQYLAEEFLRLEGFTDISYNTWGNATTDSEVLTNDRADLSAGLGCQFVAAIDSKASLVVLSGLHAGCVEIFANDRVADLRDLAGKRIAINAINGAEHIFVSSVLSLVGYDPARDVEWIWEPDYNNWPALFEAGKVDVVSLFPPQTYELREKGIGHVILNSTLDDPWRHFFCCMVAARREFVQNYPVATKRAVRALAKANQFCQIEQERAARLLLERGATNNIDYARKVLEEVPYGAWRNYDPRDTIRFYALRLREAGMVKHTPSEILDRGTDFRFIEEIRRELKV